VRRVATSATVRLESGLGVVAVESRQRRMGAASPGGMLAAPRGMPCLGRPRFQAGFSTRRAALCWALPLPARAYRHWDESIAALRSGMMEEEGKNTSKKRKTWHQKEKIAGKNTHRRLEPWPKRTK
jgi:hypothetical protein